MARGKKHKMVNSINEMLEDVWGKLEPYYNVDSATKVQSRLREFSNKFFSITKMKKPISYQDIVDKLFVISEGILQLFRRAARFVSLVNKLKSVTEMNYYVGAIREGF
jgi:hypothetical protein